MRRKVHVMTTEQTDIVSLSGKLQVIDALLIKALKISEVSQIARIEIQLRKYIWSEWEALRESAALAARASFVGGGKAAGIERAVGIVMGRWFPKVKSRYSKDFAKVYYLSRNALWKKVRTGTKFSLAYREGEVPLFEPVQKAGDDFSFGIEPDFDLVDRRAVEALTREQLFWIGEHYDKNISDSIKDVATKVMLEAGLGRDIAANMLRQLIFEKLGWVKTPFGFGGSSAQYFEMIVANAVTTARSHGHLRTMVDLEVSKYEIVNPMDSRTCPVCSHMNGKQFTVEQGMGIANAELKAKTPDAVKKAHPWISAEELRDISPSKGQVSKADSDKLAAAGIACPPFHGRCRCVITVVLDKNDLKRVFERKPL